MTGAYSNERGAQARPGTLRDMPPQRSAPPLSLRIVVFLVPLVGCLLTLLSGWPACLNPDTANSIRDGLNFRFLGYQEPTFGFIWSVALAVLPLPVAVTTFFVIQVTGYWLVFALFGRALARQRSPWLALAVVVAGFLPPLVNTVALIESNMQTGVAWSLAIALAYTYPGPRSRAAGLALIWYGFLARSGMIVAVVPILCACLLLNMPRLRIRQALLFGAAWAAVFMLISSSLNHWVLGSPSRGVIVGVSQLFDLAGIYERTGTHCIPPSLVPASTTAERILSEYDPGIANSIMYGPKGGFLEPTTVPQRTLLHACWLKTIRQHPWEYLQVKVRFARLFMMIGGESSMRVSLSCRPANVDFGLPVPDNALWRSSRQYIERSGGTLIWRGWFWMLASVLSCVLAFYKRAEHRWAVLMVLLSAVMTLVPHLVMGQGVVSRYLFLSYMLCLCSMVVRGPDAHRLRR